MIKKIKKKYFNRKADKHEKNGDFILARIARNKVRAMEDREYIRARRK